jgi:hypothetical protein
MKSLKKSYENLQGPNRFYVYQHTRADNGEVFYIGKGSGRRAWRLFDSGSRSKKWIRTANKYGVNLSIILSGLTNDAAIRIERQLINAIGRRDNNSGPLMNGTDGGEGAWGCIVKHTEESKRLISLAAMGNQRTKGMKMSDEVKSIFSSAQRMSPPRKDNKTGYKGVAIYSLRNCYTAKINIEGKVKTIGYYGKAEDAAIAYDDYAKKIWGEGNCYLNFP